MDCHVCGQLFSIDSNGIANHLTDEGDIDHDADADHVPYSLDETPNAEKAKKTGHPICPICEGTGSAYGGRCVCRMESRIAHRYYCQDPKCGFSIETKTILCGEKCPKCGKPGMDDWPPNAEGPLHTLDNEESLEYFNRYIAGDR